VIQLLKYRYEGKDSLIPEIVVDVDAAPDKITLRSPSNPKVKGDLTYKHGKQSTTLKVINAFPHGYGLGVVLIYHLAEKALERGSKEIKIGFPALTEMGFYVKMGASITETRHTDAATNASLDSMGDRIDAWRDISADLAAKAWDNSYFLGGVEEKFVRLPQSLQSALNLSMYVDFNKRKRTELIDDFLTYRAGYQTSADGLRFRDIEDLMRECQKSMKSRWEKTIYQSEL
jgi:hypothetical protein